MRMRLAVQIGLRGRLFLCGVGCSAFRRQRHDGKAGGGEVTGSTEVALGIVHGLLRACGTMQRARDIGSWIRNFTIAAVFGAPGFLDYELEGGLLTAMRVLA
jgi:hypothetical protein